MPLFDEIGIDSKELDRRKAFLCFDERDEELLRSLHEILEPHRKELIERFYEHLTSFSELRQFLGNEEKLEHLKQVQGEYFSQLTAGIYDESYVENRLHVGVAHQRFGLTPKWYMSAYCKYLGLVMPLIMECCPGNPQQVLDTWYALHKIIFLDMGLALDTYFHAEHKALLRANTYNEQIVRNMPIGFAVLDAGGLIGFLNQAVLEMFGCGDDWQGRTMGSLLDQDEIDGKIAQILMSGKHCSDFGFELVRNGIRHSFLADISIAKLGEDDAVLFMVQDITIRKQSEEEIHRLAFYDSLTHLPNRRLLQERLQQSMSISARTGKHGALMFLDLDNFKTINDTQGHDVGDLLLKAVAHRLTRRVREGDTVARLGGDEFVVALEALSVDMHEAASQSELIAEKIRSELNQPYLLNGIEQHSSPSIGVSLYQGHRNSLEEVLKQADLAMYQAKAGGRNMVCFFDPEMQREMENRAQLEKDLRASLKLGQLRLFYQMQVDETGRIVGAEALIRWIHPEKGLISPANFIPLAEEIGMIIPIGDWVVEQACEQLRLWEMDPRMRDIDLSINVSPKQLGQPYFVEMLRDTIEKTGIRASRIKIELTENHILKDVDDAIDKMNDLRATGIGFSMDDFGTGYSSLSYLKRLPLDQIKIDQSFVRDLHIDKNSAIMVRTILGIASNFGLKTVAEGVETDQQFAFLRQHGCGLYQGYYFGRPVPVEEFEKACRESET